MYHEHGDTPVRADSGGEPTPFMIAEHEIGRHGQLVLEFSQVANDRVGLTDVTGHDPPINLQRRQLVEETLSSQIVEEVQVHI